MKSGFLMMLQVNLIFVTKKENLLKKTSGLEVCKSCGKPIFKMKGKNVDYTTLEIHQCKKADITRYAKYQNMQKKKSAPIGAKRKNK